MPDDAVTRVLQVHTRYRQTGGEDAVVEAERALLEQAGIDVRQVLFDNADLREGRTLAGDASLALSAVWSRSARRRVARALDSHRSEVMHVHNTHTAASPSVYSAARVRRIPVVQTLHNYRLVCPKATVFRDGRPCTDCVGRPIALPAVVHACVRDSRAQSAVTAATIAIHRARGTFSRHVTTYVALTSFQRQVMIDGGLAPDRIRVIANFLEPDPGSGTQARDGFLFVGRLSEEKGVGTLVAAARAFPGSVAIVGGGPLAGTVERAGAEGVLRHLGPLPRSSVTDEIRRATAVLIPSVWFEGLPIVLLEAYATGTPVIASRIGSLAELVDDGVTGLLVAPGDPDDLVRRLRWARDHPDEMRRMGLGARERYESRFRGPAHLDALLDAYARSRDRVRTQ